MAPSTSSSDDEKDNSDVQMMPSQRPQSSEGSPCVLKVTPPTAATDCSDEDTAEEVEEDTDREEEEELPNCWPLTNSDTESEEEDEESVRDRFQSKLQKIEWVMRFLRHFSARPPHLASWSLKSSFFCFVSTSNDISCGWKLWSQKLRVKLEHFLSMIATRDLQSCDTELKLFNCGSGAIFPLISVYSSLRVRSGHILLQF